MRSVANNKAEATGQWPVYCQSIGVYLPKQRADASHSSTWICGARENQSGVAQEDEAKPVTRLRARF
jgi:hypothetical protein